MEQERGHVIKLAEISDLRMSYLILKYLSLDDTNHRRAMANSYNDHPDSDRIKDFPIEKVTFCCEEQIGLVCEFYWSLSCLDTDDDVEGVCKSDMTNDHIYRMLKERYSNI